MSASLPYQESIKEDRNHIQKFTWNSQKNPTYIRSPKQVRSLLAGHVTQAALIRVHVQPGEVALLAVAVLAPKVQPRPVQSVVEARLLAVKVEWGALLIGIMKA